MSSFLSLLLAGLSLAPQQSPDFASVPASPLSVLATILSSATNPHSPFLTTPGPSVPARTRAPIFVFHSGFWINLHHFVYDQALLRRPGARVDRSKIKDTVNFSSLPPAEQQNWQVALDYYQKNLTGRDLLLDSGMEKIKNTLEERETEEVLKAPELPAGLEAILNAISGSYRKTFWETQDHINKTWITQLEPLISKYGDSLTRELAKVYGTPWPEESIRVDITNYASWSGAYTSLYPSRITISSADSNNQQLAALEIIFHEASHLLIDKIRIRITEICQQEHKQPPRRDLWHALLFYTTGEIIRGHFKQYTPYACQNGLWDRAWPMYIHSLEKDWLPYIRGTDSMDSALEQLVKDLLTS